jgi:hypothetical protein
MDGSTHPKITITTESSTPPRPWKPTIDRLEGELAGLAPGEALVLGLRRDEQVDLLHYTSVLQKVHAAGHDVVLVVDPK